MPKRRDALKTLAAVAAAPSLLLPASAKAAGPIKVGALYSLTGTMAISTKVLTDTVLMGVDEINRYHGGVLGRRLEAVVADPASTWPLFSEKARQMITRDGVAAIFGCWTSMARKAVLPVVEQHNNLLFYALQYEGEELSNNVFYTGATPNQQAIPAVEYLMSQAGGSARRFVLLGTDYLYPRTTNKILRAFLKTKGVRDADLLEVYTPLATATTKPSSPTSSSSAKSAKRPWCRPSTATRTCPSTKPWPRLACAPRTCPSWPSASARSNCATWTPPPCTAIWPPGTTS